jgi:hypothetical protein
MKKIELFNNNALHEKVNEYFTIVANDCNNIKDVRFLILRFCIACEKVIDDVLHKFKKNNGDEVELILENQFLKFKIGNQKCLINFNLDNMSFAQKISLMQSICDYKETEAKYLDFLNFLREARNTVGHQLITINDAILFLDNNKDKFILDFVRQDIKPLFINQLEVRNYHEILKGLLPIISIELNELQRKIVNQTSIEK